MPRASVNSLPELEALIFVGYAQGQLREVQLFLHNNIDSRLASLETPLTLQLNRKCSFVVAHLRLPALRRARLPDNSTLKTVRSAFEESRRSQQPTD